MTLLNRIEQAWQAQVLQKNSGNPTTQFIDRAVNVPLVTQ